MAKKEKFGKFVLLEETESSWLGKEYRAAKLGSTGLEKIVNVLRLQSARTADAEIAKSLMEQVKLAAQLQSPNIVKILGIGKVDASYYISHEFIEGKNLASVLARCRQEGFPFSVDHALLIASKVCSALEYAHSRKSDGGSRYFHGWLLPSHVVISYEGEVRLKGFGYWPSRIRESGAPPAEETLYFAPEQAAGGSGNTRSDIFAVGAMLFEMLTGQAVFEGGRTQDLSERLTQARLQNPSGDDDALPKPLSDILQRSMVAEAADRYRETQELRKAVDTLLFSGDFTPTTFNLAFFMHSLFREDIDRESKVLKEEKESAYLEYLTDESARPVAAKGATPVPAPLDATVATARPAESAVRETPAPVVREEPGVRDVAPPLAAAAMTPVPAVRAPAPEPSPAVSARDAASGFTFHKDEPKRSLPILPIVGAVLIVVGAATWFFVSRSRSRTAAVQPAPPPSTLSSEAVAAMARVKELEDKLKAIEAEKTAAQTKAADEAKRKLEEQAKARGQAVDPAALQKAQEEARKKAEAEQQKKRQEELRKIEEEKKAEEARVAEEQRRADEEAARLAAAAPPPTVPTPVPAPPSTAPAPVSAQQDYNANDAGVIAPVWVQGPPPQYPLVAQTARVEGAVLVNVLVDTKGRAVEARAVSGPEVLRQAAVDWVKRQRFRPGLKDGTTVRVWHVMNVRFVLPR